MASRTTTNLRREARSRGIPRYSVLSRPALVKALHEATKKETAEDILYQLPAELGALVLEGLADPEFQYATGEWKGPQKTKEKATKLALEPCCVASDRGRRCYNAAKQISYPEAVVVNSCAQDIWLPLSLLISNKSRRRTHTAEKDSN